MVVRILTPRPPVEIAEEARFRTILRHTHVDRESDMTTIVHDNDATATVTGPEIAAFEADLRTRLGEGTHPS